MSSSMEDRLNKLREDRIAREKARIDKLRQLNLRKYSKEEPTNNLKKSVSNISIPNKITKSDTIPVRNTISHHVKVTNNVIKRPITVPTNNKTVAQTKVTKTDEKIIKKNNNKPSVLPKVEHKISIPKIGITKPIDKSKPTGDTKKPEVHFKVTEKVNLNDEDSKISKFQSRRSIAVPKNEPNVRKSLAPSKSFTKQAEARKSLQPSKLPQSTSKLNSRESVFDRLYKPKPVHKQPKEEVQKLHSDPNYLKKVLKDSGLIVNKRHTVFEAKSKVEPPVRRSISAVHFKRINRSEINNCIHKWSSIGEKLDKVHLEEIHEDDGVKGDRVISAVKSERKKVKFQTPVSFNFNTPRPEELQSRLKNWLQKRGKSIDSYHHLQCFGLHHINKQTNMKPIKVPQFEEFGDEDKENVAVEHDSDNESFADNMNDRKEDFHDAKDEGMNENNKWRRASFDCDSDFNDSVNTTVNSEGLVHHVDELLLGALHDLTEILREGYDWEQCARWLRAIRDRFPLAPRAAAYWECRAALEERRGDLPASVQCWEEAIAKGTERSVVEANLDQLLAKFMQLKISPQRGQQPDSKLVDVKNVFKSTIIRFAVQQAKLRQSLQNEAKFTVTPVRRSGRISAHFSTSKSQTRTPLRVCATVRQAKEVSGDIVFVPNENLVGTP